MKKIALLLLLAGLMSIASGQLAGDALRKHSNERFNNVNIDGTLTTDGTATFNGTAQFYADILISLGAGEETSWADSDGDSVIVRPKGGGSMGAYWQKYVDGVTLLYGADTTGGAYFAGNVGIGTTGPGEKLEVNGNIKLGDSYDILLPGQLSVINSVANTDQLTIGRNDLQGYIILSGTNKGGSDDGSIILTSRYDAALGSNANIRFRTYDGSDVTDLVIIRYGGNVGIGTTAPYHHVSIVDAAGGAGTGINIVNSAVNKNRISAATAADSASAQLYTSTAGNAQLDLKDAIGVRGGLRAQGGWTYLEANNGNDGLVLGSGGFWPASNDSKFFGSLSASAQKIRATDSLLVGGSSGGVPQSATIAVTGNKSMGVADSAAIMRINSQGHGALTLRNASGTIASFIGVQAANYSSVVSTMWINATNDTMFWRGASGNTRYVLLTDLGGVH